MHLPDNYHNDDCPNSSFIKKSMMTQLLLLLLLQRYSEASQFPGEVQMFESLSIVVSFTEHMAFEADQRELVSFGDFLGILCPVM